MRKILTGDIVYVRAGKDKGKTGEVLKIVLMKSKYGAERKRVLIRGVNLVSKTMRGNPNLNTKSRIEKIEKPIDYSNITIYNLESNAPDKVKIKVLENGGKVRIYRSSGNEIQGNVTTKAKRLAKA